MFNKAFAKSKNKVQKGFQSTSPYLGWFIFSRYLLSLDRSKNVLFLCMTLYKIYKVCKAAVTYIEYSESKDFGQGRTSRNLKKTFNFIFTLSQLKFQCSYCPEVTVMGTKGTIYLFYDCEPLLFSRIYDTCFLWISY